MGYNDANKRRKGSAVVLLLTLMGPGCSPKQ
jgi:hypothetical protein